MARYKVTFSVFSTLILIKRFVLIVVGRYVIFSVRKPRIRYERGAKLARILDTFDHDHGVPFHIYRYVRTSNKVFDCPS